MHLSTNVLSPLKDYPKMTEGIFPLDLRAILLNYEKQNMVGEKR